VAAAAFSLRQSIQAITSAIRRGGKPAAAGCHLLLKGNVKDIIFLDKEEKPMI